MNKSHRLVSIGRWGAGLAVVVGLLSPQTASAQGVGVQTSASIQVVPDTSGNIANNQIINVAIYATNTSSDLGLVSLPATIAGPIALTFGCLDCACAQVNSTNLVFVPGPQMGCVSKSADVTSCTAQGANEVLINLDADGISVPAAPGNRVPIATISLRAVNIDPNAPPPTLGLRAMTGVCAVQACNAGACVQCAAEGCSRLNFGGQMTPLIDCPHLCPNKIVFRDNGPDFFEYHAIIPVPIGWDPNTTPFTVSVKNQNGMELLLPPNLFTLPAGSFTVGTNTFTFSNNGASVVGGISFIKAALRDDIPNAYRLDIQAYADGLDTGTTNPDRPIMTTSIMIGGLTFTSTETWTRKAFGWQLNKHLP